eukprot:GSChrysophyteH1.ASY1.ANO1.352.1 assembled CDS
MAGDLAADTKAMIDELGLQGGGAKGGNKNATKTSRKDKAAKVKKPQPKAIVTGLEKSQPSIPKRIQRAMDKKAGLPDPKLMAKNEKRRREKEIDKERKVDIMVTAEGQGAVQQSTDSDRGAAGKGVTSAYSKVDNQGEFSKKWWAKFSHKGDQPLLKPEEGSNWYDFDSSDQEVGAGGEAKSHRLAAAALASLERSVEAAFKDEIAAYRRNHGGSDVKWMQELVTAGTLSDRIAAMSLLVGQSPLHELEALDLMVQMAMKKEQRASTLALEAIKDLFLHSVLPNRPLVAWGSRPLGGSELDMLTAMRWWFEGQLLTRVQKLMTALEAGLQAQQAHFKRQCMQVTLDLLEGKPEQEQRLLAMLVNKLGDPSEDIGVKATEHLRRLLRTHPAMKTVVIKEIRQLACRPGVPARAVYVAATFLSQVSLVAGEYEVAVTLVDVLVSLFERAVNSDELGSRLMSALLNGINRAFPYLKDVEGLAKHIDQLFRIVHGTSFSSATQALTLISKEPELVTRFYRALYTKLQADEVVTRARNTFFINLLYRSIKRDPSDLRAAAFLKRLTVCATHAAAPIAAGLLMLLSEVLRSRPKLLVMMTEGEAAVSTVEGGDTDKEPLLSTFDYTKREPLYACSALPSLWEMTLLRNHAHPSVQTFCKSLLEKPHRIKYSGDPTVDMSLSAFLNRFSFKNPKQRKASNIHRPLPKPEEALNTAAFIALDDSKVAPDKTFLHKFFNQRDTLLRAGKSRSRKRNKARGDSDDDSSEADSEADNEGEREADKYADKLAENMMNAYAREHGDDPDMDDLSDGSSDSEDVDSAASNSDSDAEIGGAMDFEDFKREKHPSALDEDSFDEVESGSDSDNMDEMASASDSEISGPDLSMLQAPNKVKGQPLARGKPTKEKAESSKRKRGDAVFAEVSAEWEAEMEANLASMGTRGERVGDPMKAQKGKKSRQR